MENMIPGFDQLIQEANKVMEAVSSEGAARAGMAQTLGDYAISFSINLASALAIIVGGWIVSNWVSSAVQRAFTRTKMDETYASFLGSVAKYCTVFFSLLWALTFLGLNSNGMIAILGAAGLAVGLSLKDFLTHIAAGVMLMVTRPFRVGDFIQAESVSGTVRRITLFNTEINTVYNQRIFLPNGKVWENVLTNHTYNNNRQVEVKVGVSYDDDMRAVMACIRKALDRNELVLQDPAPFIGIDELGDSAVIYLVRCWFKKSDFGKVRYGILLDIKTALDEEGFEIPYPHFVEYRKYGNPALDAGALPHKRNKPPAPLLPAKKAKAKKAVRAKKSSRTTS